MSRDVREILMAPPGTPDECLQPHDTCPHTKVLELLAPYVKGEGGSEEGER